MDRKGFPAAVLYVICQLGLVFFLYPADLIGSMETGHSLRILLGILVHVLMITIYIKGLNLAKRKDVLEIFSSTGRILAWICLLPVFFYTASAFIITIRAYSEMLILVFLPNTPVWAILLLLITISCIIVLQGIQSMARTALLAGVLFILPIVFVLCLSFQNADWRFALPLVDRYQTFFVSNNLYQTSLSVFAGGFLFLGFLPSSMDLGSALIKNGKMQGQLTAPETLMTNAYYGESVHGKIEVMDEATVQIMRDELSHKTWMKEDQPFIRSSMKLKVTILETKGHPSEEDIKKNL